MIMFTSALVQYGLWVAIGALVARLLYNKYGTGLNRVPGPFLAAFTDLWRVLVHIGWRPEVTHMQLHEKYGSLVRVGPRTVLFSDPAHLKTVYGISNPFRKSDFYPVQQHIANGRVLAGLFNTTDEAFHARFRRSVSNAYAMSTLLGFEPLVNSTTLAFIEQLGQRFADKPAEAGVCDFHRWLQYFAFDVMGELAFSKRLGFLDQGRDMDDTIQSLDRQLNYSAVVGQMPILDRLLMKNPIRLWLSKHFAWFNATSPGVRFARQCAAGRLEASARKVENSERQDFLDRFKQEQEKNPEFMTDDRVLAMTVSNIFAGSDTTAVTLRAVFYHLLKHPATMAALRKELDAEEEAGHFANRVLVGWQEVRDLPYLKAVINEGLRIHPATAISLDRVVPAAGATISGQYLRADTVIGASAWTINRDKAVYGQDSGAWRPERWIEASAAEKSAMNNTLLSFGAGTRTCIGKNVSLLEMFKVVPAVLRAFDIELAYPEEEWRVRHKFFALQDNFRIRLRSRNGGSAGGVAREADKANADQPESPRPRCL